ALCPRESVLTPSFLLPVSRRPRSTLFPYTTLFRSSKRRRGEVARRGPPGGREARRQRLGRQGAGACRRPRQGRRRQGRQEPGRRDRKSTRLNSSHVKISYAVFCLKKKNIRT